MKKCFGYVRVSTQKQGEGVSLEAQRDAILGFANREGFQIVRWFEEQETAAKGGRPLFNEMLRQLRHRKADALLMHKIDRSARNFTDWAKIGDLQDAGIDVHFATETLDFKSRGGRLTADIQAVIAADYIRNLREETIKGINGRLKQGLYPFRAPIGYLDSGRGNPKAHDPIRAPLIREMFELYASGEHSLRSLRAEMFKRGLRNTRGRPLSMCGVETIMSNPFYTGLIRIRRTGQIFDGAHEPIVPVALFRRVQDIKSGRCGKKVTRHNHLYQGLFRCGLCDGPMSPERQKGQVYYRCQAPDCATKSIREDILEAAVVEQLKSLTIDEALAGTLETEWRKNQSKSDHAEAIRSIELRIADETARLTRLTDLLIDGTLDKTAFQSREGATKLRLVDLREELAKLPDPTAAEAMHMKFLELMKSLAGLHIMGKPAEKRVIVRNCFSNRMVTGKNPCLEPHNWLKAGEMRPPVLYGAHYRNTSRTVRYPGGGETETTTFLEPLFKLL